MQSRSVLQILVIALLGSGLTCATGFGATGNSSIAVSVNVQVGCQVSRAASAAGVAISGSNRWNAPISVNCSTPMPYQVEFDRTSSAYFVGLGSSRWNLAGRLGNVQVYDSNSLEQMRAPHESSEKPEWSLKELVSPGLPPMLIDAAHCSDDGEDTGIVTVTVIY
jgi:hypothetical protein